MGREGDEDRVLPTVLFEHGERSHGGQSALFSALRQVVPPGAVDLRQEVGLSAPIHVPRKAVSGSGALLRKSLVMTQYSESVCV